MSDIDQSQQIQDAIIALHKKILYLLDIEEGRLSLDTFKRYEEILQMYLAIRGVNSTELTPLQIQFLMFLYCGCELIKTGKISAPSAVDLSNKIKRMKRVDLEIEYQKISDKGGCDDNTLKNKSFCDFLDDYLKSLSQEVGDDISKKFCIGVANSNGKTCS